MHKEKDLAEGIPEHPKNEIQRTTAILFQSQIQGARPIFFQANEIQDELPCSYLYTAPSVRPNKTP